MGILQKFLFGSIAIWTPVVPVAYAFWPKSSGGPDNIQVTIESIDFNSELISKGQIQWQGATKPKDCWSLEKYNSNSLNEFSELIVCKDKDQPSIPNLYFYQLKDSEATLVLNKSTQQAKKVISLSFKQKQWEQQVDQYLEINLVGNQKEKMKPSIISTWVDAQDLNPYKECKLIKTIGEKTIMSCEGKRNEKPFSMNFSLT
ncbi:hypothetical protein DNK47_01235 [Mycoplasma wenyonii]|uniref:Uncharacterized protein n=1 Tax=Mycoplasma wenyonii TaxID=65123 RepID=A0A328PVQ9_9MOLU|nr:hypothetical protein [Mycoplasma wenyonii]RAO95229.1 hypothetical protein DNK47_01235 [Mycoplasma wenyonii]